jgi:thymidylate kinase
MLIAFIGIDGSGKTTLAKSTAQTLRSLDREATCLTPFEYIFLNVIISFLKKVKGHGAQSSSNPLLTKSRKSPFMQFWPCLALIDNWAYFLLKIRPLLSAGKYVVCDRYFYDFAASFDYYGYANRLTRRIYLATIPRPHHTFVLDIAPRIAWARETGDTHELEFFIEQRQRYLAMAAELGAIVVDTGRDLQLTQGEILEIILSKQRQQI